MEEAMGQLSIIGKKQGAFTLTIKSADRKNPDCQPGAKAPQRFSSFEGHS
jgi:hypothetical protein